MRVQELRRLVRKYYGYVADMEGSGVEVLDMLFVRDTIQDILDGSTPEEKLVRSLYEQIHKLDHLLWEQREAFVMVVGENELQHARQQQRSPRSHWWWYLDELNVPPEPIRDWHEQLADVFAPAG